MINKIFIRNTLYRTALILFLFPLEIHCQQRVENDYLKYKFKYIDTNYKIHINSATFDSAVLQYKFYKDRITRYQDSLAVVIMFELKNWEAFYSANTQLGFTWLRASYYCWMKPKDVEELANSMNFKHPWYFYQALMNSENKISKIDDLIKTLNTKLNNTYPNIKTEGLTRKEFLMLALKNNPVRIKDERTMKLTEAYRIKHNIVDSTKIGVGCDKNDCCQKPIIKKVITLEDKSNY